ncbi:hypothetical protein DPMN_017172 [Dreissena polymorpha]|uniref:Uncharacterized protein n=1 Tax=Dreissena polymorpha TaxID=45954 RepID=A0A9D4NED2_DREPO|nr:hypothetical protein DPMN_017172 [Dreissena polymorpha]
MDDRQTGQKQYIPDHSIREHKNTPNTFAHLRGFHDDWAKNVTSRVHVIQLTGTIFQLNCHIKETNVLTKFHENWAKNVTSRRKMPHPLAAIFFSLIWTIFKLVRDINKTNVLSNFHDDWAKIVTSRVFTRKTAPPPTPPPPPRPGSHETNVLTKFHKNWAKNVTSRVEKCPAHWWPCLSTICIIFEKQYLTNFHDDWAKIVTSRVFTRKTAPPTGGNTNILTNFELHRDFIGTKLLTKFH